MALTDDQKKFVVSLSTLGARWVLKSRIPVAAMVACGALESNFGTRGVYLKTGCPFNLQKPPSWDYPHCKVLTSKTATDREEKHFVTTTFCIADDLGDAARIFCEWIDHWPNPGARNAVFLQRDNAKAFARSLPLVGFGVAKVGGGNQGDEYAAFVDKVQDSIPFGPPTADPDP
jgi:hypothetical protein